MYKFLETSKLQKFTQKETDNPNSPIAKKNEFLILCLPTKKTTGLCDFIAYVQKYFS